MTPDERDAFLSDTRLGMLTMLNEQGNPLAVPVWFEWDESAVRMFRSSRLLRSDGYAPFPEHRS